MSTAQRLNTRLFLNLVRHPIKYRLYLLTRLPSAFFSGLRVVKAEEDHCTVSIPFKWFTKNPFRSTYFACLSMAAEMSTGVLAMAHVYRRQPHISMLVTRIEAEFLKKAVGTVHFNCSDGAAIKDAILLANTTGESRTIVAHSVGTNTAGETVALFNITWSFKIKASDHSV